MKRTYWLLETRSDDVTRNPEMPMRYPPLFAHMLSQSSKDTFDPVEVQVSGGRGLFCFQVKVEQKSFQQRVRNWWGVEEKTVIEESFVVQNLGPSPILCGPEELKPHKKAKGDSVTICFAGASLKDVKIRNTKGLCGEGERAERGDVRMTFRIVPEEGGDPKEGHNYLFYTGRERSRPNDALVGDFHKDWFGNYEDLESEHGFIQWLFPLFLNSGVNWEAHKLGRSEAREIRRNMDAAVNVVRSYRLMLDFYGFRLVDDITGEVAPLEDEKAREARFNNFNYSSHNYLRISTPYSFYCYCYCYFKFYFDFYFSAYIDFSWTARIHSVQEAFP